MQVTVCCLALLFILTFWGTIDQATNGLYLAQERFFNSLVFIIGGFIPFPGARLVLWVMFINLVLAMRARLVFRWNQAGIIIIHIGLFLFFISAFVIFHGSKETHVSLSEGNSTNVSTSYQDWELSVWSQKNEKQQVLAYDTDDFKPGQKLNFSEYGISIFVERYFPNAEAYIQKDPSYSAEIVNASGIKSLKKIALNPEPGNNFPGGIFRVEGADKKKLRILLYGGEENQIKIFKDNNAYYIKLRRKRVSLPFLLKLKDFKKELYPDTQMARSYESLVEIIPSEGGGAREILISMNKPLRYKDFTLYQASYAVDKFGREMSTLAVVKNAGRLLPYISSLTTCFGLLLHLIMMGLRRKKLKNG